MRLAVVAGLPAARIKLQAADLHIHIRALGVDVGKAVDIACLCVRRLLRGAVIPHMQVAGACLCLGVVQHLLDRAVGLLHFQCRHSARIQQGDMAGVDAVLQRTALRGAECSSGDKGLVHLARVCCIGVDKANLPCRGFQLQTQVFDQRIRQGLGAGLLLHGNIRLDAGRDQGCGSQRQDRQQGYTDHKLHQRGAFAVL